MKGKFLFTSILVGAISVLFAGINITPADTATPDTSFKVIPLKEGEIYVQK